MATTYDGLFNSFLKKVERDRKFFQYFNLTASAAEALATERCIAFLDEACGRLMIECAPDVDFTNRNDSQKTFNFDLSPMEKYLIPCLMYESYLGRDVAYLKNLTVNYSIADVKVFDPSNYRSTFMAMYESVKAANAHLLEEYRSKDRLTGQFLSIDQSVSVESYD